MKTNLTFALFMIFGFLITGCKQEKKIDVEEVKIDLINDEFPDAKAEVIAFMDTLAQTIKNSEADKLISLHAYGPKFTSFSKGKKRVGSVENEKNERAMFKGEGELVKFNYDDLKIAVYGDVANVTFHSDFQFKFGEKLFVVNNQVTLLLVKTNAEWKFVHEHHSPLKLDENKNVLQQR